MNHSQEYLICITAQHELLEDYLKAVGMLSIDNDKLTLQKQVAELTKKTEENYVLKHNDKVKEDALATLSDQVMKPMVEVQELKKQR